MNQKQKMRRVLPFAFASMATLAACVIAAPKPSNPPERDAQTVTVVQGVNAARLEKTVRDLAAFPTRHTLSGARGADAAALYLAQQLSEISRENNGRLKVWRDTWTQPAGVRMTAPADLTNVIATLPGTETPERVLIISGHYDSRVTDVMDTTSKAPGANDDASGVAVVVELARLMSKQQWPCTVVFACVTGEEQGLYGSTHLAAQMKDQNKNVMAMLTNDIVGNSTGQGGKKDDKHVRVFSAGYDPTETPAVATRKRAWGTSEETPMRGLARAFADATRRYAKNGIETVLVMRNDRYGRGGDHSPFVAQGWAAARITEPNEDWRHQHQDLRVEKGTQYGDLPDYVDYAYLARVARANAACIASLADAPSAPQSVTLKGDLDPQTTLTWTPAPNTAAVEVLWRKTTAPDWEGGKQIPAQQGTAQTTVLPLSKDDYLFAVRAVGKNGARSLPAIPVGGR